MDEYLTAGNAIELVRGVRGPGAIQTVKVQSIRVIVTCHDQHYKLLHSFPLYQQYNFIMGFHRHIGEIRPRVFQS